jgi:hypothetical protein
MLENPHTFLMKTGSYKIEMLICSYLRLFCAADFSLAHASEIP